MAKLGFKEIVACAALTLLSTPAAAESPKDAETRQGCEEVAEGVRRLIQMVIDQLDFTTSGTAFIPSRTAQKVEAECLEKKGLKPKALQDWLDRIGQ